MLDIIENNIKRLLKFAVKLFFIIIIQLIRRYNENWNVTWCWWRSNGRLD